MVCPICNQSITWEGNAFRPFCSERCKMIDLDNWLAERYRVPAQIDSEAESAAEDQGAGGKGERE